MEKVTVNIESIADAMEATMDGWEQYLCITGVRLLKNLENLTHNGCKTPQFMVKLR